MPKMLSAWVLVALLLCLGWSLPAHADAESSGPMGWVDSMIEGWAEWLSAWWQGLTEESPPAEGDSGAEDYGPVGDPYG